MSPSWFAEIFSVRSGDEWTQLSPLLHPYAYMIHSPSLPQLTAVDKVA